MKLNENILMNFRGTSEILDQAHFNLLKRNIDRLTKRIRIKDTDLLHYMMTEIKDEKIKQDIKEIEVSYKASYMDSRGNLYVSNHVCQKHCIPNVWPYLITLFQTKESDNEMVALLIDTIKSKPNKMFHQLCYALSKTGQGKIVQDLLCCEGK